MSPSSGWTNAVLVHLLVMLYVACLFVAFFCNASLGLACAAIYCKYVLAVEIVCNRVFFCWACLWLLTHGTADPLTRRHVHSNEPRLVIVWLVCTLVQIQSWAYNAKVYASFITCSCCFWWCVHMIAQLLAAILCSTSFCLMCENHFNWWRTWFRPTVFGYEMRHKAWKKNSFAVCQSVVCLDVGSYICKVSCKNYCISMKFASISSSARKMTDNRPNDYEDAVEALAQHWHLIVILWLKNKCDCSTIHCNLSLLSGPFAL